VKNSSQKNDLMKPFGIAIHGGAGTILASDMTEALRSAYEQALRSALDAGYDVLEQKGSATDAVVAAVQMLEDNILFNAGRGSVFTKKGLHEMDAAVMEGFTLDAGAVAGVSQVKNPVMLARAVMDKSDHVFLSGEGARDFALEHGLAMEPDSYFFSQFRFDQWKAMRDSDEYVLDHSHKEMEELMKDKKFGTVGAVACDINGNLAAATSTGGMTNKNYGRIGDTPVIGIGNYANNNTCAISCTGHGELFIRAVAAYDVSALMEYKGMTLEDAMHEVVMLKLKKIGGEGGMIGIDANCNISMTFNSAGMYRGKRDSSGKEEIAIFK
jgi:L-asparaginase / beta-aspartyl-peptidase